MWGIMEKKMETIIMGYMGGCQNDGPFLGPYYTTAPNILGYPKKGHNFDNHPYELESEMRKGSLYRIM